MNSLARGFSSILLLLIVALAVAGGGYYYVNHSSQEKFVVQSAAVSSTSPSVTASGAGQLQKSASTSSAATAAPTKAEIQAEITEKKAEFAKITLLDPAGETLRTEILALQSQIGASAHPSATIDASTLNVSSTPWAGITIKGTATNTNGIIIFFLSDDYKGSTDYADVARGYNENNNTAQIYGSYPTPASNGYWSAWFVVSSDNQNYYHRIAVYDFLTHALLVSGTVNVKDDTSSAGTPDDFGSFDEATLNTSSHMPTLTGTMGGYPSASLRLLGPDNLWHKSATVPIVDGKWSITFTEDLASGNYAVFLYGQPFGQLLETDTLRISP
jgi:hypothetical protein